MFKHDEFQPILPNIVDDTMKEPTHAFAKRAQDRSYQKPIVPQQQTKKHVYEDSLGRKIITGILLTIIVVLVLLLIYQLYKYYVIDEEQISDNGTPCHAQPSDTSTMLPVHVRNLDNDVLKQYVTKKGTETPKQPSHHVYQSHISKDVGNVVHAPIPAGLMDKKELERINTIIEVKCEEDDDVPSKDEMTQLLKDSMAEDKEATTLETIEEEDDVVCDFETSRGKKKGVKCGKPSVIDGRCQKHIR
jgi:cell division protein FtsL